VRHNGAWYPFFPTRLRLRGDLVVGGVDGGEAENSHQALVPIVAVRVQFDGEEWKTIDTIPTPIPPGGRNRFWVAPAEGNCPALTAQGLDRDGKVVGKERLDYAACSSG
jgi:hypothetical protein